MRDKAKEYSRIRHALAIINIFLTPFLLFISLILGIPSNFKNLSILASANDYFNLIIFSGLLAIFYYLLNLPIQYYAGFILEHKFSLSNQTFKDWVKRELKKSAVMSIISMPLIIALYAALRLWPETWWLCIALLWFSASIILAKFAPVVIIPLFYKYSPIKDTALEDRLNSLVAKAGFKPSGVYELNISKDTKKANAALLGIGKQKRIVLCDTLIANFSPDEIESVMAHELGHHKLNHIWKLLVSGGIFTFSTFFLTNLSFLKFRHFFGENLFYGYESLVIIYFILSLLNILISPIGNAFSRRLEKNADIFSLKMTGNIDAFISTMKKLGKQNLADIKPNAFYEIMLYDHPPIARRIALAESFKTNKK